MSRRYNKLGLRRDLNFTDIPNKLTALNNLLNGLVDVVGESFISEDLDALRNLSATKISNADFLKINGLALKVTEQIDGVVTDVVYKPIVKVKNKLDVSKFTIGLPFLFGGDGLTNRYYNNNPGVINSTATNPNDIFIGTVENGNPTHKETFWESGYFSFGSKFKNNYTDIYGGVQWDGYFKPTSNVNFYFTLASASFFTFEFDDGLGNLILHKRKSQYEYQFYVQPAPAGSVYLTLISPDLTKNLLFNDVLINNSITQFQDPDIAPVRVGINIIGIDPISGVIALSAPLIAELGVAVTAGQTYTVSTPGSSSLVQWQARFSGLTAPPIAGQVITATSTGLIEGGGKVNTNFTFRFRIGATVGNITHTTYVLEQYKPYKIRMRYWIPEIPQITARSNRDFTVNVNSIYDNGPVLNFKLLYAEDYAINDTSGEFRKFYNTKLNLFGGTVGGLTYNDYQSIISKSPVNISYEPKTTLSNVIRQSKTVNTSITSDILGMDNTDKIEIGNYVFDNDGTIIEFGTRVKDIALNIGVFLSQYPKENSASIPVTFVDHKGLLGFDNATSYTSGGYSLTNVDPSVIADLKLGDVVINSHTPQYTVVTRISGTTVTVSNPFSGNGTNVRSFFYRAKGLYNDSLAAYSTGVFAAPTVLTSASGSNTLTVAYTDSIVNGMVVQFGNKIAAGTTVSAINQTTKVITLSGTSPITETIPVGQLIVFAPAGTTDNKEICFTPLDISPPFIATESGMQSTVDRPNLEIIPAGGVAGELKFVGLSATGVTVTGVPNLPAPTYNTTLLIKDATGASYKILATT